jgi:hypothetical protein
MDITYYHGPGHIDCDVAGHHPDLAVRKDATTSATVPPPTRLHDSPITPHRPTSRDLATENAKARNTNISDTSAIAHSVRGSNSRGISASQQAEGVGTMRQPFVSSLLLTPIPTPDPRNTDSSVLSPSIDVAPMQSDYDRHSLGTRLRPQLQSLRPVLPKFPRSQIIPVMHVMERPVHNTIVRIRTFPF